MATQDTEPAPAGEPQNAKKQKQIPKPVDFLLTIPLYEKIQYSGVEGWEIVETLFFRGTYDSFCVECRRESTFQATGPDRPTDFIRNPQREAALRKLNAMGGLSGPEPQVPPIKNGVYLVHTHCTRSHNHVQDFAFFVDSGLAVDGNGPVQFFNTFEKIGQHPSYADLHLADIKKYSPVLTKAQLSELVKAIGLASHGVGIGSYVYLRRIFEALVEEAHTIAKADQGWQEEIFSRSRMSEKIATLKDHLPEFLVDHPQMYSILSIGIHELSEEDCIKHFATLRLGIEMILDEKLEQKNKAEKSALAKRAIQTALGHVNGSK
jgi:hypothetical protein